MKSCLLLSFVAILIAFFSFSTVQCSQEEGASSKDPICDRMGIELPVWEDYDYRESFDIRIWPEATVVWLEQENLRDLIADPATSEEERVEFKRILALQNAFRST